MANGTAQVLQKKTIKQLTKEAAKIRADLQEYMDDLKMYSKQEFWEAINETKKALDRVRPKYIIQTKEGREVANFLDNYELRYKIGNVRIYERQS